MKEEKMYSLYNNEVDECVSSFCFYKAITETGLFIKKRNVFG